MSWVDAINAGAAVPWIDRSGRWPWNVALRPSFVKPPFLWTKHAPINDNAGYWLRMWQMSPVGRRAAFSLLRR
jgi:hypothetical protein